MLGTLRRPGWYRGALGLLLGAGLGFGLVVALRAISGLPIFQTEQTGYPHVIVPAITGPLGFLVGFGCFDYWFRWAAGKPTIPDDHSGHGAHSWRDYFKFNTDHKVIGIQYICTNIFFFFVGGLIAMIMRAELAQPGTQIVDASTFNGLFSVHAALMIFVVSWRFGPRAEANPWRAKTIEWQVSSPPPVFNFDEIPRVVGGPYEYGVPGARHAIMAGEEAEVRTPEPTTVGSS